MYGFVMTGPLAAKTDQTDSTPVTTTVYRASATHIAQKHGAPSDPATVARRFDSLAKGGARVHNVVAGDHAA